MHRDLKEMTDVLHAFGLTLDDTTDPKTQAGAMAYLFAEILRSALENWTGCSCSLLVPSGGKQYRWYVRGPADYEYELTAAQAKDAITLLQHSGGPAAWAHLAAARGFKIVAAR